MKPTLSVTAAAVAAAAAIAGCGNSNSISDQDHKDFVRGCSTTQTSQACECLFTQLTKKQGVDTDKKMEDLKKRIQAAAGDPRKIPTNYRSAVLACRKFIQPKSG